MLQQNLYIFQPSLRNKMERIQAAHKDEYMEKMAELYDRDPDLERMEYDNPDEDAYHQERMKTHPEEYEFSSSEEKWKKLAEESPDGVPF